MNHFRNYSALAASGLALWACNGIVGIETLHHEDDPNAGGSSTHGGTEGTAAKGGAVGAGAGGKLATGGAGGSTAGAGGAAPINGGAPGLGGNIANDAGAGGAEGGTFGEAGAGGVSVGSGGTSSGGTSAGGKSAGGASSGGTSSGGANTGGSGGTGTAVSGTLIDLWGHPLPNVPITIGSASAVTNSAGKFTVANVAATYDVTISLHPMIGGGTGNYAWIYQGLTRRDPTLQVYRGLANQDANPTIKVTGGSDQNKNIFAWGCPDGSNDTSFTPSPTGYTPLGALSWFGPSQTTGAYHALAIKKDSNGLPTAYSDYVTAPLTVTADTTVEIPMTFTGTALATSTIGGTVSSVTTSSRTNYLFARFTDNAVIPIANPTASAAAFSFVTPTIQGADFTVAASEGSDDFYGPFAIAHKTVAAGTTNVALSIPATPTHIAPANNRSDVSASTQFSWASANDTVFVLHVESDPHYEGMYIVTTAKSLKLPDVGGGFFLEKNELHWWQVEVHGDYTAVDQVARPGGFLDSFGRSRTEPDFYRAQDTGYVAVSSATGFYTAP